MSPTKVSIALSEQVLAALHELLRGFQSVHQMSGKRLLHDVLAKAPAEIYGGLLTTLLRLVFILYAEDRDGPMKCATKYWPGSSR